MKVYTRKSILSWIVKIILSLIALYLVSKKIHVKELLEMNFSLKWEWLIPGLIFFNLSKILSAFRLNMLFENTGLKLDNIQNILLYYVGMFYNLFLPGGIGGDGYKVYLLKKNYGLKHKSLVSAVLYDRINGVASLVFIVIIMAIPFFIKFKFYLLTGAILYFPLFYLFTFLLFPVFMSSFFKGNLYSLSVQLNQLIVIVFILKCLEIQPVNFLPYLLVFLVSSIAAALPLSVGGIGARELVFAYGTSYLATDTSIGIVVSILFFIITALSSFAGIIIPEKRIFKKINAI